MSRPPIFPPPQFPPVKLRMFQRMPPAVFPAIMGLFGLGLALRRAATAQLVPAALAEVVLGAVSLIWAFAALGYLVKMAQRRGVLLEDLAVLPGRTGLAAMSLCVFLLAAVVLPYAPEVARAMMFAGLILHAGLALMILWWHRTVAPEARAVTPAWHLHFVGFIIAGVTAVPLGYDGFGQILLYLSLAVAVLIYAASLRQLIGRIPPAPLRPLLAIHLAPPSLLGLVAALLGYGVLAQSFAVFGALVLVALLVAARWITAAGFSALWGAFCFPLAAYGSLLIVLDGVWIWPGVAVLMATLAIVPLIAIKVFQGWTRGTLAAKTNAATA